MRFFIRLEFTIFWGEVFSFPSALGELHEVCSCFISDRIGHKETEVLGIPRKISLS